MPQPPEKGIALQHGLFPLNKLSRQSGRIAVPLGPCDKGLIGIEMFDDRCGIAGGNAIVPKIPGVDKEGISALKTMQDALAKSRTSVKAKIFRNQKFLTLTLHLR